MKGLLKFITCGSVDDGKSTLIGHILYDAKLLYADQEKTLELVDRSQRKDTAAFAQLVTEFQPMVFRLAFRLLCDEDEARDITQETFVKAIKAVDRFKGDCDIKVWLCQIAKNTYFTYAGKQNREQVDGDVVNNRSESQAALIGDAEYDLISETVDKEQAIKIHRILHELPEPYKEVFTLRVFGELRFGQIADIFGKTESWARVTYHRARMMIMDKM